MASPSPSSSTCLGAGYERSRTFPRSFGISRRVIRSGGRRGGGLACRRDSSRAVASRSTSTVRAPSCSRISTFSSARPPPLAGMEAKFACWLCSPLRLGAYQAGGRDDLGEEQRGGAADVSSSPRDQYGSPVQPSRAQLRLGLCHVFQGNGWSGGEPIDACSNRLARVRVGGRRFQSEFRRTCHIFLPRFFGQKSFGSKISAFTGFRQNPKNQENLSLNYAKSKQYPLRDSEKLTLASRGK